MTVVKLADKTKPATTEALVALLESLLERARSGELLSITCQETTMAGGNYHQVINTGDEPWLIALQTQHLHELRAALFEES